MVLNFKCSESFRSQENLTVTVAGYIYKGWSEPVVGRECLTLFTYKTLKHYPKVKPSAEAMF